MLPNHCGSVFSAFAAARRPSRSPPRSPGTPPITFINCRALNRPTNARALETYLNTVCDHGFNASAFAARVIVSTRSDVISAIAGAVGALKGPLHGGAPGPALNMVFEIACRPDAHRNRYPGKAGSG